MSIQEVVAMCAENILRSEQLVALKTKFLDSIEALQKENSKQDAGTRRVKARHTCVVAEPSYWKAKEAECLQTSRVVLGKLIPDMLNTHPHHWGRVA